MTNALAHLRRLAGILGPTLGIVLVCSLVVAGVHHHTGSSEGHACAVCTASHAPAVTTVAAAGSPTPALLPGRVDAPRAELPLQVRVVAIAARAPPLA